MRKPLFIAGALAAAALVSAGFGGDDPARRTGADPPMARVAVTVDPRLVMGLIWDGRVDSALSLLRGEEHANSVDPMVHLLRARAMRDKLADEDDDKSLIGRDAVPIHEELDRAIKICNKALRHPASDPTYLYYRGRAWLAKAQIYTLTRSYWSAGRSASRAKRDLERYLRHAPDHPDAQGDLGAFLYFADTLPGVIKLISKVLFIPGGDRERGLEMLRYAATHGGPFSTDYQFALGAIQLVFEGRLEEGTATMGELIERYPYYTRLIEPFGVLAPLYPLRLRDFQRLEDRVVARHLSRGGESIDWNLVKRIQLHRAYSNMFFLAPSQALHELTILIENPMERPDWALPLALINRGCLYAKQGETEKAIEAFRFVASRDEMKHFHRLARGLVRSLETPWHTLDLHDLDFVGSIYDGDLATARTGLREYDEAHGRDALYYFYLGEIELFAQDFVAAASAYATCLEVEVYGGDQTYQMFAALRLAEIHGHEANYDRAVKHIDKALKYTHTGYLFDFMVHSRKRYYEMLEKGIITTPPSLLFHTPAEHSASPRAEQN